VDFFAPELEDNWQCVDGDYDTRFYKQKHIVKTSALDATEFKSFLAWCNKNMSELVKAGYPAELAACTDLAFLFE